MSAGSCPATLRVGPVELEIATLSHAAELAPQLRLADLAEVWAAGYLDAFDALSHSLEVSSVAYAARIEGQLAALCGVAPDCAMASLAPQEGTVWLLTGAAVARHPMAFWRSLRPALRLLISASGCRTLGNLVDARYTGAVRMLQALGFSVEPPKQSPPQGILTHRVVLEAPDA